MKLKPKKHSNFLKFLTTLSTKFIIYQNFRDFHQASDKIAAMQSFYLKRAERNGVFLKIYICCKITS